MATLPTNFKDDILDTSVNTRRRYRVYENTDGTIELEDVTEYSQVGDVFGAGQINSTNTEVNKKFDKNMIVRDLDTINAITKEGYAPDALALKEVNDSLQWKYYDMLLNTKGTEITYPDSFTELKILVTRQYNGAKPMFDEFSTSKEEIEKLATYRLENGATTGGGSASQIVIIFTETGVAIENIHVNGSALESNYAIYVFYR